MALNEKGVLEALLVRAISCFVEIVHVQLTDEATEVIVLEVFWKDLVRELVYLLNYETIALGVPGNNIVGGGILDYFEGF